MYQRLVGKLIHLSHTRSDIAHVLNVIGQLIHCPKEVHLGTVYSILCYLKSIPGKGIFFQKYEKLSLKVCNDADWPRLMADP